MAIERGIAALILVGTLAGCDSNAKAVYGDTGLPKNCRAYVQVAIDDYRARKYPADEVMNGLERNCGINGHSWDQ